jgi:signal transduction histidine kinase
VRRGPTLRQLLLGVNVFILLVPVCAVFLLPVLDAYLIRQTERRLIGESVVVGEAWRSALLRELGHPEERVPAYRPPALADERYTPFTALTDMRYRVLPPAPPPERFVAIDDRPVDRAGDAIAALLLRAQVFNLSGVRVLDDSGCVVASSRGELGGCLDHLDEVRTALAGEYAAVVRQRLSDEPPPPLTSVRRRGGLRVFTATPVFMDGRVIGVVRMSRTAVSPLEALWTHRGKVALVLVLSLVVTPAVTYSLSHAISRPVRTLTARAEAIASGQEPDPFTPGRLAPREVRVLSAALDRMTDQLTQRARYISEFASNVSHELKTPITGIAGASELLQDEWEAMAPDQRKRFLDNIASDAERMERLVNRLLHLARIQASPEEAVPVDVSESLRRLAGRYGSSVELRLPPDLPTLTMNPEHLETAVRNLVDNAVRHGGGEPVSLGATRRDGRVVIEVRDRGPGISPANRDRILDRFFTTERDRGGTGLGLSIVQAVAETRGGSVEVESDSGGACFRLTL